MWNKGEQVVLQATTRFKKREGTLFLTTQRLAWKGHDMMDLGVSIEFGHIKSQFVNQTLQTGRVMLKIALYEIDSEYLFIFTAESEEKAFKEREAIKDALAQILGRLKTQSKPTVTTEATAPSNEVTKIVSPTPLEPTTMNSKVETVITKEELKWRATLLAKNKDLLRLHKELVLPGHITEEEFWASRKHLLGAQHLQAKQKKGLPSSLLADIRPTTDISSSDIKYTLTPMIIHTIFLQYPQVHRIYKENVPDKVSLRERKPIMK
jgi:transcription initiation factor TFIIH subunit 1